LEQGLNIIKVIKEVFQIIPAKDKVKRQTDNIEQKEYMLGFLVVNFKSEKTFGIWQKNIIYNMFSETEQLLKEAGGLDETESLEDLDETESLLREAAAFGSNDRRNTSKTTDSSGSSTKKRDRERPRAKNSKARI
jgi:hypothetical protein